MVLWLFNFNLYLVLSSAVLGGRVIASVCLTSQPFVNSFLPTIFPALRRGRPSRGGGWVFLLKDKIFFFFKVSTRNIYRSGQFTRRFTKLKFGMNWVIASRLGAFNKIFHP